MRVSTALGVAVVLGTAVAVSAQCPGAFGDSMCQAKAGPTSFCVPGTWRCQGASINCGCDFRSPIVVPTPPPSAVTIPTLPPSTTSPPTVAPVSSSLRWTRSIRMPMESSSPTRPSTMTTAPPSVVPTSGPCGSSPSRPLFVWAEWPNISTPAQVSEYFGKLLSFINDNCGNFVVRKLVLRVMDPSGIWEVSPNSLFYTQFLAKLPRNIELFVYPYLFSAASQALWGPRPLEAVFKYVSDWNKVSGVNMVGVTLDLEEKNGFISELPSVQLYKAKYGVNKFGLAIGYDATGSVVSYPMVDEFFLEMYDFYVNNAQTLTLVQANTMGSQGNPRGFLEVLVRDVLGPYVSKYGDKRFNFMWSLQAKAGTACLYPLGNGCGSSNDFGSWSAPAFSQFLSDLIEQYPVFAGRSHGLFQFSFVPKTWV